MRAKIMIPIVLLLLAFCGVLGFSVFTNVSAATISLLDKQLDSSLDVIQKNLLELKSESDTTNRQLSDARFQNEVEVHGVAGGGILVVDEDGEVIADSLNIMTGQKLAQAVWYQEARASLNSTFSAEFGQAEVYAHSTVFEDKLLVSYLPSNAIEELFVTPLYVIGVVGVISVTILAIFIYFLVTRQLINPIESLEDQVSELGAGQKINVKSLKATKELVRVAEYINAQQDRQLGSRAQAAGNQAAPAAVTNVSAPAAAAASTATFGTPVAAQDAPFNAPVGTPVLAGQTAPAVAASSVPSTESFDFIEFLRGACEQYRTLFAEKKLKFSLRVNKAVPRTVDANKEELLTTLNNALAQAASEGVPGSRIEGYVAHDPLTHTEEDGATMVIIVTLNYNGQEQNVLLRVKRG